MTKLMLTAALILLPGLALAAPLASSDGNANYGCKWEQGENTNALVLKGNCDGVPVITGGYKTTTETTEIDLGCETATITERVERESRGGAELSRDVVDVSFE